VLSVQGKNFGLPEMRKAYFFMRPIEGSGTGRRNLRAAWSNFYPSQHFIRFTHACRRCWIRDLGLETVDAGANDANTQSATITWMRVA